MDRTAFAIAKVDEAENLIFGWSSVALDAEGTALVDTQGDIIEPAILEKAIYKFVMYSGVANKQHQGEVCGQLIESLVVTPEKLAVMGLVNKSAPQVAHWVGFKVDPAITAQVKNGDLEMFSIEGRAVREAA